MSLNKLPMSAPNQLQTKETSTGSLQGWEPEEALTHLVWHTRQGKTYLSLLSISKTTIG